MSIFKYVDNDSYDCFGVRVVIKNRNERGKRIQREKRLGPCTLKHAKIQERILKDEVKREMASRSSLGPNWRDLLDRFNSELMQDPARISTSSETTLHDYVVSLRRHTNSWMNRSAMSLCSNDIMALMNELDQIGLSHSRKKHIRTAINLIFDWASRKRLIAPSIISPAKGISIGKKLKRRQPILTLAQIRNFLDEANRINHEFYELWAVAFLTGMRSGELFELKWSDICYERKVVRVERSYNKRRNIVKSTKSGDWREVPINSELASLLERLRLKTGATGYVLPRINSWRRGEASKVTRSFCQAINVPEINFHATRACFAVQLLQAKVSVPVVMKIGGWSEFKSFQHYLRLAGVDIENATDGLKLLPITAELPKPIELRSLG